MAVDDTGARPNAVSDTARSVGEVEPDFDAAEVRAFGADGRGDAGAEVAGRADVAREFRMNIAELGDFVHGGLENFFLGVEASTHGPFVEKMEKRAGFVEADGFGIRENIERDFERDTTIEKLVFGRPCVEHGAIVSFLGARIRGEKHGRDVVGFAGVGQRE